MTRNCISLLIIVFISFISGCGTSNNALDENIPPRLEEETIELSFKNVELEETPESLKKWIEENKANEQKKVFNVEGKIYVVVLLGEMSTNNYDVIITQIHDVKIIEGDEIRKGNTSVSYKIAKVQKEITESKGITYPLTIAEVESDISNWVQFDRSLTEEELEGMEEWNESDSSVSDNAHSNTIRATGGGVAVLVPLETLTQEGEVKID